MNIQLVESIKQVIQALPIEEQTWLRQQLLQESRLDSRSQIDLNQFDGTLQLSEDPRSFQLRIRDEWQ